MSAYADTIPRVNKILLILKSSTFLFIEERNVLSDRVRIALILKNTLDLSYCVSFYINCISFDDNKIIDKLPMVNSSRLILSYHLIKRERMLSDDTRSATNVLTMSVHHNVACRDFRETWPKMIVLIKAS